MKRFSHPLTLLALLLLTCVACEQPPAQPPTSPPPPPATREALPSTPPGAAAILDDQGLRPLDAPLDPLHPEGEGSPRAVASPGPPAPMLLFTAALRGYVEPCTCTLDTVLGGIDRITGYVRTLQGGGAALMIDAGDALFEAAELDPRDVEQARLKAALIIQAHRAMGTRSTTPGRKDLALGLEVYRGLLEESGIGVTVANLDDAQGAPLGVSHRLLSVAGLQIGLVGVVDPALFEGLEEVRARPAGPALAEALAALEGADIRVVIAQGDLAFARTLAESAANIDVIIPGHDPRLTDEVTVVGQTALVEAYSQGRHLGMIKLYVPEGHRGPYQNARQGSRSELEKIDRRIRYLDEAISKAPPATPGKEPPLLKKLREQLNEARARRLEISSEGVTPPVDARAFAYFSIPMAPGYPHDRAVWERKQRYNERLEQLYTQEMTLEVRPAIEGQATYVGGEQCVSCHEEDHEVWLETPHSHAWETLVNKGKAFDPECVSCHVTGYDQPGGSIVGKVEGLESVQCESCHGPGSIHVEDPDEVGEPGQVWREVPEAICVSCHDPENSPRFRHETYLPLILGEGHGQ